MRQPAIRRAGRAVTVGVVIGDPADCGYDYDNDHGHATTGTMAARFGSMRQSMDSHLRDFILRATGADDLFPAGTIQSLWSGYGSIDRYGLVGGDRATVVLKHVRLPEGGRHPRGWNTDLSHRRKLRSYQVETAWYEHWAGHCDAHCRIPRCLARSIIGTTC